MNCRRTPPHSHHPRERRSVKTQAEREVRTGERWDWREEKGEEMMEELTVSNEGQEQESNNLIKT